MKTLLEIQNEVARENNPLAVGWKTLMEAAQNKYWPEVCRRAQLECGRATLETAAEKASALIDEDIKGNCFPVIIKSSITSESNIVIIE